MYASATQLTCDNFNRHFEASLLFSTIIPFLHKDKKRMSQSEDLTRLLSRLSAGDNSVLNRITPIVVDELHRLASAYMNRENAGHTLQATALVNEAYLKLVNMDIDWQDRGHFYAIAARQMRHILVDHARAKSASKRGGHLLRVDFDDALEVTADNITDLIYLDDLLTELQQFDERAGRIFELRLFSGLSNREIASLEKLSVATVEREIRVAKAWIQNELVNHS